MFGFYNVQPSENTEVIRRSENVIDPGLNFVSSRKNKRLTYAWITSDQH